MAPLQVAFIAGTAGPWRIERMSTVAGAGLPLADRLLVAEQVGEASSDAHWMLKGTTSNLRYTKRAEADALAARQEGLGRPSAICAALIPIRKSEAWWTMAQDERRAIMEEQSRHIAIGMDYLPGVARRLHHSRELGEPFDFLTWFEYAPEQAGRFETLVERLRATTEWGYVEREVDIRLTRE